VEWYKLNSIEAIPVRLRIVCAAAMLFAPLGMVLAQTPPGDTASRPAEPPIDALVRADKNTIALTLPVRGGPPAKLLLSGFEFDGDAVSTDKLHLREIAPGVFEVTSIAYAVGEWRVRIRDAASYYGLGERSDTLNHAHTVVHNLSQTTSGPRGSSTSQPIPFFMSTTGYGIWFDTTGDAAFDLNATSSKEIIVDCDAEKLRIVLLTGPEFPTILAAFTAQAGRSALPPYWAFAPWIDAGGASKARELGLAESVAVSDSPAAGLALTKELHREAYKVVVPATRAIARDVAEELGSPIQPAAGASVPVVDFTNRHATQLWQDNLREAVRNGADGFWMDGATGESAAGVRFSDDSDPRMMRNRYAALENHAADEVVRKDLKGDGVLLIRGTTAGDNGIGLLRGGPFAASFSPEDGLPAAVTAGLNAGLSGMPLWLADLGGSLRPASPDPLLFMRWTEYAAFSPVMEMGSPGSLPPWGYGDEALAVYRRFSTLHMATFPYRYAAAQEAEETGMPMMRALALQYQDDEKARQARYEYLFGPDLLVAPIVDEGTQRTVYLPAGEWIDYWTGQAFAGRRTILAEAAIDSIPVYVRQGAVIPMLPDDVTTLVPTSESGNKALKTMDDRRVYEIFGDTSGTETIPTNNTTDFEGRKVVRVGNTLTISGDSAAHVILRWRFQKIVFATVNGAPANLEMDAKGAFIEFDHLSQSAIAWR